uniref:Peptidase A2 domain-containing protein n=1 Tax=Amphimedon queenslandica TaxID=400682 RepID=A0A1X7SU28_AMPQE
MWKIHETGHPLNFYDDNGDLKSLAALADRSCGIVVLLAQLHPIDLLLYADTMLNLLRRLLSVSNLTLGLRKTYRPTVDGDRRVRPKYLVDTGAEVSTIPPNKLDRQEGPAGLSLQAVNGSQISTVPRITPTEEYSGSSEA